MRPIFTTKSSGRIMKNFSDQIAGNPIFEAVAKAGQNLNVKAYVIGGYVRDLLLKRPSKDIDFVCVGSGIELAHETARQLNRPPETVAFFKNFGTAMLKVNDYELEFVGARKESYRKESRKPMVENGTLEDDQNRRDFTINALAISLNPENFGEMIDPFDGLQDLKRQLIKTPLDPNITFSDDPLRMMRAIRFATQLKFDIDPNTFEAIIQNKDRIEIVSKERINTELNKIILTSKPSYGFKLLFVAGLLEQIFPELTAMHGIETIDGKSHKDNFYHTLQVLDNVCEYSDNLWLRWAAILHDIAKPATKRFDKKVGWTFHGHEDRGARMVPHIFRKMKLPMHEEMKYVQKLVRLHLRPIALVKDHVTDSAIRRLLYEAGETTDDLMKLCRADITSKDHRRVQRYLENFNKVEQKMAQVEERDQMRNFQPVITGNIIMETFGIQPSKDVGKIKIRIREAIMDGKIRNEYEEAYEFMLETGQKFGLQLVQRISKPQISEKETSSMDSKL